MESETDPKPMVNTPAIMMLSIMLVVLSWELTIAMFAAHFIVGPGWLTPNKRWVAFGVSTFLTLQHQFYGRRQLNQYKEMIVGRRPYITYWQAALVVALVIGAGVFATWLFFVPD